MKFKMNVQAFALASFISALLPVHAGWQEWLIYQALDQVDTAHSGPHIGNTHIYSEIELGKALANNDLKGTPEQIQMIKVGPVYFTKSGIQPVGQNRPYRLNHDGYQSDMLYLFSTGLSEEFQTKLADASIKTHGVMVLRGLLYNSVDETVKALQPLLEQGAIVMLDPRVDLTFGKRLVGKSPVLVHALVRKDGTYGCEKDAATTCIPYTSVTGLSRPLFGKVDVRATIERHLEMNEILAKDPSSVAFYRLYKQRISGFSN